MNKEQFYLELENHNIILNDIQKKQFQIYCDFLLEYNKHTNLTAIKDENQVYLKHFYDSSSICFNNKFTNEKILDIGTGPGFPGMLIKILFPNVELTLLDSNNKKTKFLEELAKKLDLDVNIVNDRAENLINREYYDVITSRAVADLRILVELSIPLLKVNGIMIAQKSHIEDELSNAKDTIEILNSKVEKIEHLNLSEELGERNLVVISKNKITPNIYPRKYDKILKNPLKR